MTGMEVEREMEREREGEERERERGRREGGRQRDRRSHAKSSEHLASEVLSLSRSCSHRYAWIYNTYVYIHTYTYVYVHIPNVAILPYISSIPGEGIRMSFPAAPGRIMAGSSDSMRFVAMITCPVLLCTPKAWNVIKINPFSRVKTPPTPNYNQYPIHKRA